MRNLNETGRRFYPELIFSVITILAVAAMCVLIQHKILHSKVPPAKTAVAIQKKAPLKTAVPATTLAQPADTKAVGVRMTAAD